MSFLFSFWSNKKIYIDKNKDKVSNKLLQEEKNNYSSIVNEDKRFYYLSLFKKSRNNWSIHGLWPQYDKDNYPVYCKKVNFNFNNLNPIINNLVKYWYSEDGKSLQDDETFWKHEWEKHGSCVFTNIDEFTYFNTTLNLYQFSLQKGLPDKYYDEKTKKCLIPVDLNFQFIDKK